MMVSIPGSPVYLNPAHTDFIPGVTELRWKPMSTCMAVVGMLMLVIASFWTVSVIQNTITNSQRNQALWRESIAYQGEIVHCIPIPRGSIDIAYYYLVEGQRYTQSTTLPYKTCALHNAGAQVNLHYARSNPAIARLDGQSPGIDIVPTMFIILLTGTLAFSMWLYFAQKPHWNALRAHGQVLDGELTSVKEEFQGSGGYRRRYLIVRYKLMSPTGKLLEGYQQTSDSDLVARRNLFSPGTPVKVLYADDKTFLML
jgi:hypothetical protein